MTENESGSGSPKGVERVARVLVMENYADIREMLCLRFRARGLEAVCVESCADALRELKERRFSAAVLDLGMTPIDGKTCGGYIHTLYPNLPLVAYTGYPEAADEKRIMQEYGFRKRFVKFRDDEAMIDAVCALARAKEMTA